MIYINDTTGEVYQGGAITRRLDNGGVFTGVPTEEDLLSWGFEPYDPPAPERTLEDAKEEKIAEITAYDTSDAVNSFNIDGDIMWISRDDRISIMNSTTILKNAGQTTTTLWGNGKKYILPCDTLIQMLSLLEIYALQCYDVTEEHKAKVNALYEIDEVDEYDYMTGYPEQLSFDTTALT